MKKIFNKIIDFIVNKRIIFIILFSIFAIISIYLFTKVKVNNDISTYLDPKSDTRIAYGKMQDDFGAVNSFNLMVEDITKGEALEIQKKIDTIDGVATVIYNEDSNYKDNSALYIIMTIYDSYSEESKACVNNIKSELSGYKIYLSGGVVEMQFLGDSVVRNMVQILLWASLIVIVIIFLNSKSWIEPLIFAIIIFTSIIINLGTNAFFSSVSFVTQSICAVMQLALAMDYSIMFLHRYMQLREENQNDSPSEIVKETLKQVTLPILGSSLTTVAGLLTLITLRFRLGLDIGVVLTKGIIISLLTTFVFMPGVIILFSKLIDKTKHRNLYTIILDKFPKIKTSVNNIQFKTRFIIPSIVLILVIIGAIFNFKIKFAYSLEASSDPNSQLNQDIKKINETFGVRNSVMILVSKDGSELDNEKEIISYLENYEYNGKKAFNNSLGLTQIYYYDYYTYNELAELFNLPSFIIKDIYFKIDSNITESTKLQVKDIIEFIKKEDYINKYLDNLSKKLESINTVASHLEDNLSPSDGSHYINELLDQGIYNENQIKNLFVSVYGEDYINYTYKDLVTYLVNENYIYNVINGIYRYDEINKELNNEISKEELINTFNITDNIDELYNNSDKVLITLVNLLKDNNINLNNDTLNEYLNVINTKDTVISSNEAYNLETNNIRILPQALIMTGMKLKSSIAIGELISNLAKSTILESNYSKFDFSNYKNYIKYLDENVDIKEIANLLEIDEAQISSYFETYNIPISNLIEILKSIVNENIILKIGNEVNNKLNSALELINYALSQFEGKNYNRLVANMVYLRSSDEQSIILRDVKSYLKNNYSNVYLASEGSTFIDFEDTFATDSIKINVLSFLFILIIIAISFRSLSIPLILTLLIEGAIWVTLGISYLSGHSEYFICYLMVVCIQMGTTIDYGILYTSNYVEKRRTMDKKDAMKVAFFDSLPTILTSGMILIFASWVVGKISEVSIISSIGFLLSKGSIVSVAFIIIALPQILLIFDKLVIKKNKNLS